MYEIRAPRPRHQTFLLPLLLAGIVLLVPPTTAGQENPVELMQQGIDKIAGGDAEGGLRELQKAIEIEPRLAAAHYYAGQASAQLQRWDDAYAYFLAAADYAPGYGEAHMQACRVAYTLEKFDESWEHAILAAQAGIDMEAAFAGLEAKTGPRENLRQRLEAPRVLIGNIDTSAILAQGTLLDQSGGAGAGADQRGAAPADPFADVAIPGSSAGAFPLPLGQGGAGQLSQVQADIFEVRRRFGLQLVASPEFAVAPSPDISQYVFFIKVDAIGDPPAPRPLTGFIKLYDIATEEEVYSRPLELKNIVSVSDLRNDVGRYVGYMEAWLREQRRND